MNKYLLIFSSLLFIVTASEAQFSKGSILLGGQLSFSTSSADYNPNPNPNANTSVGNFNVSVGKAIHENAVFGLEVSYGYYNYGTGSQASSNNNYGIGLFYRKYKDLGKEFFLFGQAGATYLGSTQSGHDINGNKVTIYTTNGGEVYLYPGIAYKISNKFFLELTIPELFSINYNSTKTTYPGPEVVGNQFSVSTSLSSNPLNSLGIGFRLVL
jgi:hypothetical protein